MLIIAEIRNLPNVPVFVENINIEVAQLCNINIDGAWVSMFHIFEKQAERTDFFPGDIRDRFSVKFRSNPVKENSKIGSISCDGSIRKFAERKDIRVLFGIIVMIHGVSPPVRK